MIIKTVVKNSAGTFLVSTVPSYMNIEFGTGYETLVHPVKNGIPNMNVNVDYKHSVDRLSAKEDHQKLVDKHSKL